MYFIASVQIKGMSVMKKFYLYYRGVVSGRISNVLNCLQALSHFGIPHLTRRMIAAARHLYSGISLPKRNPRTVIHLTLS